MSAPPTDVASTSTPAPEPSHPGNDSSSAPMPAIGASGPSSDIPTIGDSTESNDAHARASGAVTSEAEEGEAVARRSVTGAMDWEKQRQETIRRNAELLKAQGLLEAAQALQKGTKKRGGRSKGATTRTSTKAHTPTSTTPRTRGAVAAAAAAAAAATTTTTSAPASPASSLESPNIDVNTTRNNAPAVFVEDSVSSAPKDVSLLPIDTSAASIDASTPSVGVSKDAHDVSAPSVNGSNIAKEASKVTPGATIDAVNAPKDAFASSVNGPSKETPSPLSGSVGDAPTAQSMPSPPAPLSTMSTPTVQGTPLPSALKRAASPSSLASSAEQRNLLELIVLDENAPDWLRDALDYFEILAGGGPSWVELIDTWQRFEMHMGYPDSRVRHHSLRAGG